MRFITILLLLALTLPALAAAGDSGEKIFKENPGSKEFSGRMIVRPLQVDALIAQGLSVAQVAAKREQAASRLDQIRIRHEIAMDEHIVILPDGFDENSFSSELMRTGDYQYVEPDWLCYPIRTPNDPNYNQQWHHPKIDSPEAWDIYTGSLSHTAAWVDTGVYKSHEDLSAHLVSGYNSKDRQPESSGGDVSDVNGHGTNVAGCIGAIGNNSKGCAGVCWTVSLMPIRATNRSDGSAYMSDLTHGATWAAQHGAKTISVSYSGVSSSSVQSCGVTVKNNGGLLIWAAGNEGSSLNFDHNDVVIAGATDQSDNRAYFSNYGTAIDVMAPGVNIYTTKRYGGYSSVDGTSFSAPLTNGLCALIWASAPTSSPDDIETYLFDGCDYIGSSGTYGHGRINVYESLLLAGGGPPAPDLSVTMDLDGSSYQRGDNIGYDLTITNNGTASASTYFWINITLPNSNIYPGSGYLEGPLNTSVNAGANQVWGFSRRVPNFAPIGSYSMNGYIGVAPPTADDTDSAPFSITP